MLSIVESFVSYLDTFSEEFSFEILEESDVDVAYARASYASLCRRASISSYRSFLQRNENNKRVVLQVLGHSIDRAALFRSCSGKPTWPVLGMTHDLADRRVFEALVLYGTLTRARSDTIICASRTAQRILEHYTSCIDESIRPIGLHLPIVSHGVDARTIKRVPKREARLELGLSESEIVFLYFGRISLWQKADLRGLVRTFCERFRGRRATLIIAGSAVNEDGNPDVSALMDEIRVWTSWTNCKVKVYTNVDVSWKQTLHSAADIFVSPSNSLQETFGLSIAEAMLYQLPVVATKWSGYQDIVVDKATGFLINTNVVLDAYVAASHPYMSGHQRALQTVRAVKIDWNAYAEKMDALYQSDDLRIRLGLAGAVRARQLFSVEMMMISYQHIWNSALEARKNDPVDCRCYGPSVQVLLEAASTSLGGFGTDLDEGETQGPNGRARFVRKKGYTGFELKSSLDRG
jgi:glycosyltransferase involved in cell wall biosynthesis